jgi:hypothetical protein
VEIFQENDQRLPSRKSPEEFGDRLEEVARVAASSTDRLADGRGLPRPWEFRQEACQLGPPAGLERIDELPLLQNLASPESVHPGRKGQDPLGLVAPPDQHASLPLGRGRQ